MRPLTFNAGLSSRLSPIQERKKISRNILSRRRRKKKKLIHRLSKKPLKNKQTKTSTNYLRKKRKALQPSE
jgi:hypothetical protein